MRLDKNWHTPAPHCPLRLTASHSVKVSWVCGLCPRISGLQVNWISSPSAMYVPPTISGPLWWAQRREGHYLHPGSLCCCWESLLDVELQPTFWWLSPVSILSSRMIERMCIFLHTERSKRPFCSKMFHLRAPFFFFPSIWTVVFRVEFRVQS